MNNWHKIKTQEDIELLMNTYGNFHDACMVSMNYNSGAFVDDGGTLYYGNENDRRLSVIFHCQWKPKTIELAFLGLRQMHIVGWQDNYACDISDAYLAFHNHLLPGKPEQVIVWADTDRFDIDKIDNAVKEPADTYIIANELSWRIINE